MQRARSRARKHQERRSAEYRYQIQREEEDKLSDLSEGERAVDSCLGRLAQHLHAVRRFGEEDALRGYKIDSAFVYENCLCFC